MSAPAAPHVPLCAICDRPETGTHYGTFTQWRGQHAHRGCALDFDSDMADTYGRRDR